MIKDKGNFSKAKEELENNAAVSHLYNFPSSIAGPLSDVVVTIKDLYATEDAPTQASSKILEGFNSGYDATIIKKLKSNGASIVAKVHLDELALGGTGRFSAYGPIMNPRNSERIVGGSSSGSAATFTNSIGAAIGSDTGDSVRLPASYNGFYGFKPSYGAISRYGQFAFASSLDTVAYFTHNLQDTISISNSLYGIDEMDMTTKDIEKPINVSKKPKSIGFIKNDNEMMDYQKSAYKNLMENIKNDGIEIKEFEIDQSILDSIDTVYQIIAFSEASSNDANLNGISFGPGRNGNDWNKIMFNSRSELLGKHVQRRFALGAYFLSNENLKPVFYKAQKVRRLITEEFNKIKEQVDVLVFPATTIAPLISEKKNSSWIGSYLINSNLSGTPSVVIPWEEHDNMPFGLAIEGLLYKDKELLSHSIYIDKLIRGEHE